ncbi:hypothetical protein ALQ30_200211 [Pseudomonas syringae pv. persicae]|uniref:Uncharacterized protein n=1 Tax=Pseudomonas syringae pv. persicae TaxID=237306 RepID=A0A3M4B7T6_9PSED|nr:hypothetical protein ALQ30_200211 [Pseudomonas syringae pv. persicae]
MILIEAHGVGFITTEQVNARHDHVNMGFALNRLTRFFISNRFYFG